MKPTPRPDDGFVGLRWPLGRSGTRSWWWSASLALTLALPLLIAVDHAVAMVAAIVCWLFGIGLQAMVAAFCLGKHSIITLAISGVWAAPVSLESNPPIRTVVAWFSSVTVLLLLGSLAIGWHGVNDPQSDLSIFYMPSLGTEAIDDPMAAAGWLWIMQAVWQTLPIPQSFGRVGWTVSVAMLASDAIVALRRIRAAIVAFAIVVFGFSLLRRPIAEFDQPVFTASSYALMVIAIWLLISARDQDLGRIVRRCGDGGDVGRWRERVSWTRWRQNRLEKRLQSRRDEELRQTRQREFAEAEQERDRKAIQDAADRQRKEDANRAEAVLAKLHQRGLASLDEEERALLRRVSEAVRQQRTDNA